MMEYHVRIRGVLRLCLLVLGLSMLATTAHAAPKVTLCHYSPDKARPNQITVGLLPCRTIWRMAIS
jgi:hypothetical protein